MDVELIRHGGGRVRHHSNGTPVLNFGPTLRKFRESKNLSQRNLAERLELSASYLSLLESMQRRPTREQIVSIAKALKLEPAEERSLLASGGFAVDELDTAISRVVEIIAEQTDIDAVAFNLVLSDLQSVVYGWQAAFEGTGKLHGGEFSNAADYYGALVNNTQYSPTLLIYLENRFADALLRTGELGQAMRIAQQMRQQVDGLPDDWTPSLKAEVVATQAMLALREGNYGRARNLLEMSKNKYGALLSGSGVDESIANQGFGRSYKRLAQLALFEGDVGSALNSCLAAEAYLSRTPPSWTRNLWLRRTHELKGWAYSKLGTRDDIQRAIDIHTQTRNECESVGDTYGAIMGWLYIADDLRRALQIAIANAGQVNPDLAPPTKRRAMLRQGLTGEEIARAMDCYQRALEGITQVDDHLMAGRCRSRLAIVQRFHGSLAATRGEAERIYEQAQENLRQALEIDQHIGQGRRLPSIYLTMANIAWDRAEWEPSQLDLAQTLVEEALSALNSPMISSSDSAASSLRGRLERARASLAVQIGQINGSKDAGVSAHGPTPIATRRWNEQCDNLVELVLTYVQQDKCAPYPGTDKSEEWLEKILSVEMMPGQRILAQNKLSVSLSLLLPSGAHADYADLYVRRYNVYQRNVRAAELSEDRQPNRDLCCRETVNRNLREASTAEATREGLDQAKQLMQPEQGKQPGHILESTALPLPLAFMVKGPHVLIEVPVPHAMRFAPDRARQLLPGQALCYAIEDADLARALTVVFERLLQLARETLEGQPGTRDWLEKSLTDALVLNGAVSAGSI